MGTGWKGNLGKWMSSASRRKATFARRSPSSSGRITGAAFFVGCSSPLSSLRPRCVFTRLARKECLSESKSCSSFETTVTPKVGRISLQTHVRRSKSLFVLVVVDRASSNLSEWPKVTSVWRSLAPRVPGVERAGATRAGSTAELKIRWPRHSSFGGELSCRNSDRAPSHPGRCY